MLNRFQIWLATRNWSVLPAPVWFLIASPLLAYAIGGSLFNWPAGCTKHPFHPSFWCVAKAKW